jgi:hypothetical protein
MCAQTTTGLAPVPAAPLPALRQQRTRAVSALRIVTPELVMVAARLLPGLSPTEDVDWSITGAAAVQPATSVEQDRALEAVAGPAGRDVTKDTQLGARSREENEPVPVDRFDAAGPPAELLGVRAR